MKPLLVILSYAKANDMVQRHWPYFLKAGCDILGVGREDSEARFPGERLVGMVKIGKDSYVAGDNLIKLHLDALAYCLEKYPDYTHYVLTEPDAIFTKPLPVLGTMFSATKVGGWSPGFHGRQFFHGPWCFNAVTAARFVEFGTRMLHAGLIERGFPDRFHGLLCDLYSLPWTNFPGYSQNRLDQPKYVDDARQAIKDGYHYIHGIKTEAELRAVTEGLV